MQGLIQLAAALHHRKEGRPRPAERLAASAREKLLGLEALPPLLSRVDLDALVALLPEAPEAPLCRLFERIGKDAGAAGGHGGGEARVDTTVARSEGPGPGDPEREELGGHEGRDRARG